MSSIVRDLIALSRMSGFKITSKETAGQSGLIIEAYGKIYDASWCTVEDGLYGAAVFFKALEYYKDNPEVFNEVGHDQK